MTENRQRSRPWSWSLKGFGNRPQSATGQLAHIPLSDWMNWSSWNTP